MRNMTRRLKDLFDPGTPESDWCDTTRLANPWSVLLGGRRREADSQGPSAGDAKPDAPGNRDATTGRSLPDLRETEQARDGKDGHR